MGERYYLGSIAVMLAEALYDQGRFDEAAQMIEEPLGEASPLMRRGRRLTKAKLLARRGQFAAARRLADERGRWLPPTASPLAQAMVHEASAEVERLAGAPGQAATRLRAALEIYEDRRATALAERARTALASLAAQPGATRRSPPARWFNAIATSPQHPSLTLPVNRPATRPTRQSPAVPHRLGAPPAVLTVFRSVGGPMRLQLCSLPPSSSGHIEQLPSR